MASVHDILHVYYRALSSWTCPRCTTKNAPGLSTCSVCGEARPERDWVCAECSFFNELTENACEMCDAPRARAHHHRRPSIHVFLGILYQAGTEDLVRMILDLTGAHATELVFVDPAFFGQYAEYFRPAPTWQKMDRLPELGLKMIDATSVIPSRLVHRIVNDRRLTDAELQEIFRKVKHFGKFHYVQHDGAYYMPETASKVLPADLFNLLQDAGMQPSGYHRTTDGNQRYDEFTILDGVVIRFFARIYDANFIRYLDGLRAQTPSDITITNTTVFGSHGTLGTMKVDELTLAINELAARHRVRYVIQVENMDVQVTINLDDVKASSSQFVDVMEAYDYLFNQMTDVNRLRRRYEEALHKKVSQRVYRAMRFLLRTNRFVDDSGVWIYRRAP